MQLESHSSPSPHYENGVRRHPRYPFSVPVTFRYLLPEGFRSCHGMSLDISEGGMGAIVQDDLRVGESVKIDLPLPGGALTMVAIVRYTSSSRSGLEFLGLTPEERTRITSTGKIVQPEHGRLLGI